MKLRVVGDCFSEDTLNSDRRALEELGIFTHISLSYTGPIQSRQISLALQSAPIRVGDVLIKKFGLPVEEASLQTLDLPLKAGPVYERANAEESLKKLQSYFQSQETQVEVSEFDELTTDHLLEVCFEVLSFPKDRIIINGHAVSPLVATPTNK